MWYRWRFHTAERCDCCVDYFIALSRSWGIFHAGPVGDDLFYFLVYGDIESNEVEDGVAEEESDGEEVGEVRAVRQMSWCVWWM